MTKQTTNDLVMIVIALILPPLAMFLHVGLTKHFFINIILCLFGYVPGIIHAVYMIAKK